MEYRKIPYVEKKLSALVFGCANAKMLTKPKLFHWNEVFSLLDAALDAGINVFDTAENYGASEVVLGTWLQKRKVRDDVVLLTKGCHPHGKPRVTAEALKGDIEKSFRQLRTEYIDIYMLHRDHPDADIKEIVEVLNEYRKAGKIGAFGASNWTHSRIEEANEYALNKGLQPFSVSSPNFGPARQMADPWGGGCVSISGPDNEEARIWYQEKQIPVFAYSCLGRGMFSGKIKTSELEQTKSVLDKFAVKGYWCQENLDRLARMEKIAQDRSVSVSQVAIAWTLQQGFTVFPIITVSGAGRIKENVDAASLKLSESEMNSISQI